MDVQGQNLRNVIITKLPFPPFNTPLNIKKSEALEAQGKSPFSTFLLPEAVLKFKQGVGRLIRSHTDEGLIVVLDPRIVRKGYGRVFLAALPPCPVTRYTLEAGVPL